MIASSVFQALTQNIDILGLLSFGAAVVLLLWGYSYLLIKSFATEIYWGVLGLVLPIFVLIFSFIHWDDAKRGFYLLVAGCALVYFAHLPPTQRGLFSSAPGLEGYWYAPESGDWVYISQQNFIHSFQEKSKSKFSIDSVGEFNYKHDFPYTLGATSDNPDEISLGYMHRGSMGIVRVDHKYWKVPRTMASPLVASVDHTKFATFAKTN